MRCWKGGTPVELRDLSVRFGDKILFDHRDFFVPDQGITLLAGPSGVGKTTLLRAFFQAYPQDSAYLFQEDRLLPWRTARQHLTDVLPKSRRDEAGKFLALVELEGEEQSYPAQFSGGMARRLALARALALDCRRYLLDEPFAGVDLPRQERILARIRGLGRPVLLSGHAPELRQWADHILELE